jgi:hypothetical protein
VITATAGQSIIGSGLTIATAGGTFGAGDYIFPSQLTVGASTTLQNFTAVNATTTSATSTNMATTWMCLSNDCRSAWPTGGSSAYDFPLAGNATSTLTQFNGGLTAFASSTIGSGTQAGGLTVSGGATTTGNAYFTNNVGINVLTYPAILTVQGTTTSGNGKALALLNSSATPVPLLTVDNSGWVGIGTSSNNTGFLQGGVMDLVGTTSSGWNFFMGNEGGINAHSATGVMPNKTFGVLRQGTNTGGVELLGLTAGNRTGLTLTGVQGISSFNKAIPSILLKGSGQSGTTQGLLTGDSILMQTSNLTTVVQTIMGNGSLGQGTTTPWAFSSWNSGSSTQPLLAMSTTTGNNLVLIDSTGRFGLGTTSPYATLSITGSSDLGNSALAGFFTATSSTASSFAGGLTAYASSTIGNGVSGLTVNGPATTTGNLQVGTGASTAFVVDTTGNVGIGTSSPSFPLSVLGQVVASYFTATTSTASTFPYASTTVLSASTICITTDCRTAWPTGSALAWMFALTGNATSTLTQFNGGLTAYASSTIGNGTVTGGLTVNGTATTSGLVIPGLATPAGTFTAADSTGHLIATTSPSPQPTMVAAHTSATIDNYQQFTTRAGSVITAIVSCNSNTSKQVSIDYKWVTDSATTTWGKSATNGTPTLNFGTTATTTNTINVHVASNAGCTNNLGDGTDGGTYMFRLDY